MSERRFDILFDGSVINGHDVSLVKNNVQTLFKLSDEQVDKIFCGKPVAIKRALDRKTATQYQSALTKAGAKIQLVLHQADPAAVTSPAAAASTDSQQANQAAPAMANNADELDTLPPGSPLLTDQERTTTPAHAVDVSHLSLEKPNPFLSTDSDTTVAPVTETVAADFDLAEPGTMLVAPRDIEVVELPDIENWSLAEIGSLLGQMQTPAPAQVVINSELAIVEQQGYLLDTDERKTQEAVEVDTSGLELMEGPP